MIIFAALAALHMASEMAQMMLVYFDGFDGQQLFRIGFAYEELERQHDDQAPREKTCTPLFHTR